MTCAKSEVSYAQRRKHVGDHSWIIQSPNGLMKILILALVIVCVVLARVVVGDHVHHPLSDHSQDQGLVTVTTGGYLIVVILLVLARALGKCTISKSLYFFI